MIYCTMMMMTMMMIVDIRIVLQVHTDFQNSVTDGFSGTICNGIPTTQFPPHLKRVAAITCKILRRLVLGVFRCL